MKIMKNRFRKRLAFLLIFTILVMALSPVGCVKRADAADETNTADDVIKLYDKGQLIGKYGDLKTTFENMTDSEGEYKIIFSAEQTEPFCISILTPSAAPSRYDSLLSILKSNVPPS